MPTEQAITDYLAGTLPPEEVAVLEEELLASPERLSEFIEQQCMDAALAALFDPAPERVEAAILASIQTVSDEVMERRVLAHTVRASTPRRQILRRAPRPQKLERPSWIPSFIFAMATVLVLAGGIWWNVFRDRKVQPAAAIARLRMDAGARWQRPIQQGAELRAGPLVLNAGVAELEFHNGVALVMEGPVRIELANVNRVILRSGKVAADVPPNARGFTVETAVGSVTDLGTRFGVQVTASGVTEAHVFEGRVKVSASAVFGSASQELRRDMALALDPQRGTLTSIKSTPELFPQPSREITDLLSGGEFEPGTDVSAPDIPRVAHVWSGDPCEILDAFDGIRPHAGSGMLRFLQPSWLKSEALSKSSLAEKWQLADLRPLKEWIERGSAMIDGAARFNCKRSGPYDGSGFRVEVLAFTGNPADAKTLWHRRAEAALARAEGTVKTDDNQNTWELAETKLLLPPATDFLLFSVQSYGSWDLPGAEQVGRFADSASLRLHIPPQTSTARH